MPSVADALIQSTIDQVRGLIDGAATSPRLQRPKEHPFLPTTAARVNHIILLDDRLDTHAIMTALLSQWSARIVRQERPINVVPIEGLHMSPQPPMACNYMSLLVALRPLSEYLEEALRSHGGHIKPWRRVAGAIAAWSGNVKARAPYLDPESYAREVEEEHRASGYMEPAWAAHVSSLANGLQTIYGSPPVIVMPVRDISGANDPNDLLQAMAKLQHPNLIYLCSGNLEILRRAPAYDRVIANSQIFPNP